MFKQTTSVRVLISYDTHQENNGISYQAMYVYLICQEPAI